MSETILRVANLEKTYGKGLRKKGHRALDGVSLEVGRGTVFGLLGPNGAGKTTLVKILLGLVRGHRGLAEVFGEPVGAPLPRARVGFLPEAHRLPPYLTGWEVLRLFGGQCGKTRSWLDERIPHWLARVGMTKDAHRKIREYSKGMQQRIGLAQALIHEPELIFLDEPTDGVDPVGRRAVREIVQEQKARGATIFINSHLLAEVEAVSDRVVIMDKGKIVREGTVDELTVGSGSYRFEIDPFRADLAELLRGVGNVVSSQPIAESGRGAFFVVLEDERGLDAAIDRLRAAKIGIRAIGRPKRTLEEAFIDVVQETRP